MNITDLVLATERLPEKIEDLLPLRFIGQQAVNFYRDKVALINKLELSIEQRDETLRDGQDAGKALLMIEAKIGELHAKTPLAQSGRAAQKAKVLGAQTQKGRVETFEEKGIDRFTAWRAQRIFENPDVVEEVIREAEEQDDIPTKQAVLNKVSYRLEKERVKGKEEKTRMELKGAALIYYGKLQDVINTLPPHPPRDLFEGDYKILKALALVIIKRLEVFLDEPERESKTGEGARRISG